MEKTILVVDDDQIIRDLLRYSFSEQGFHVLTAENGFDALDLFADEAFRCDFAIIDQSMPGMTGMDFCRQLRELRPVLKIIISTGGYASESDFEDVKALGIIRLIRKPFNLGDLIALLKSELGCS
jgi:two-component system, cell cycle sensor histidine kinase and response regulator CckA